MQHLKKEKGAKKANWEYSKKGWGMVRINKHSQNSKEDEEQDMTMFRFILDSSHTELCVHQTHSSSIIRGGSVTQVLKLFATYSHKSVYI